MTPTFDYLARKYGLFIQPRRLGQVQTSTPYPPDQSLAGKA
jgi:hypothetical protein